MLKRLGSLLHVLLSRGRFEEGMNDELRFHIEEYTRDLISSGISPEEARRRARLEFGSANAAREQCRQARGLRLFDELHRQSVYALRLLRKSPASTFTALSTLALCIGANLSIFAVMDSVLLRPLPFKNSGRLVTIYNTYPRANVDRDGASLTNYYERRDHIAALSSVAIYRDITGIVGEAASRQRRPVMQVSPDFFHVLETGPALGRAFKEDETVPNADGVAIVTAAYWRKSLDEDKNVLGRQIRVDGFPKTIVGVLPPDFQFLSAQSQIFLPLSSSPAARGPLQRHSGGNVTQMIARLRPDASIEQAQREVDAQNNALERDDPQGKLMAEAGFRSVVVGLHADHVAAVRPLLLLLQTGVAVLLLIGTVNLTNLLLIRANARSKELAVRQALGAGMLSVVGEAIVEGTMLSAAGVILGLAIAAGGVRLLLHLGAGQLPLGFGITLDWSSATVAFCLVCLLGLVFAAPSIWFSLHSAGGLALQSESRTGTASHAAQFIRHSFIVAQVALSCVLLTVAGLLALSLARALAVSPGFQPSGVISGRVTLVGKKYPDPASGLAFIERITSSLERQPGVIAAGVSTRLPFTSENGKSAVTVDDYVLRRGDSPRGHYALGVGGDYFKALGFTLRAGRFLDRDDSRRKERVCVVDEDFAHYYWPNSNALGHRLFQGSSRLSAAEAFTVVGVVVSAKQAGLTDETRQGAVYFPFIHQADYRLFVSLRGSGDLNPLRLTLEKTIRRVDGELSVDDLRFMAERIAASLLPGRSAAILAGLFAGVALLLTVSGTYGVLSYAVARRSREIGVRIALGALPVQIGKHFLGLAARLVGAGTVTGLTGAFLIARTMRSLVFHANGAAFPTVLIAVGLLAGVSLLACLLPSYRASKLTPLKALANE